MAHSSPRISIVLSDRNWILERLGRELQTRIERVELNDAADPSADINYYITFACRKAPAPTLEMAWFAHMEQSPDLQDRFYSTAKDIDLPVTHSKLYRDMLHQKGLKSAIAIPPGVDHDRFQPKLRIGVVGRAYHTGRKGEGLIAQLMDLDGIDWHFTGTGWPLPGKHLPDADLPDFYRSMDYILVPALYEGGPMCVPEALAVGTPVIASSVGWVPEFPHIPFKNGDATDLRRVLTELLAIKRELRDSTLAYSWDNYAAEHDRVFHELFKRADKKSRLHSGAAKGPVFARPVRLLMHGNESKALGGPSIRVPRTAEALRDIGVPAKSATYNGVTEIAEDIVHLFNVWNPDSALGAMHKLKRAGKKVVFSPIYLDLGERDFWHFQLPGLDLDDLDNLQAAYQQARAHQKGRGRLPEPVPGYNAMIREMINLADHVIFLSTVEREALAAIGAVVEDARASTVRNPVDAELWQSGDPALFRDEFLKNSPAPQDYIVCIGRIEQRKNQLLLARAMRDMPLRLVLVGHVGDPSYVEKIKAEAGDQVLMVGRLDPGSDMMRSALSGASVFALPSWSEGASLAALEAAAAGSNMVLSDRSSEQEYFGDLAQYCDPGDPVSIRKAMDAALNRNDQQKRKAKIQALVAKNNTWEHYAQDTCKAYASALQAPMREIPAPPVTPLRKFSKIAFDITTLAHHSGRITGISRVEALLAQALGSRGHEVTFICWNDNIQRFVEVPTRFARMNQARKYRETFDNQSATVPITLAEDCTVIVPGSAWMQNSRYVQGLEDLKARCNCGLVSVIYDLVPFKFPFWFDAKYAPVFRDNFYRLTAISDLVLTDSQSCAQDVRTALTNSPRVMPPITTIRLGDPVLRAGETSDETLTSSPLRAQFAGQRFVLAVGAIHLRKNYEMLYRVWARFADEGTNRDLNLVIVGGVAWNGKALADMIAADIRVNQRIHILSGIEDDDLAWLYQNCLFTVFPSYYEGWGLPVAESLVQGKMCLATSASSVTEIAPDIVEHIDPEDFASWHQKIGFYAASRSARDAKEAAIRSNYAPHSWEETAQDIFKHATEARNVASSLPLYPGAPVSANIAAVPRSLLFRSGWHRAEKWGRWSSADNCSITLNLGSTVNTVRECVLLLIRQKAFLPGGGYRQYTVKIKGEPLYEANVSQCKFPGELILRLPVSLIDATGDLNLEFSLPVASEKTGARNLGLGLVSVCVLDTLYSNPLQVLDTTAEWISGDSPTHVDLYLPEHRKIVGADLVFVPAWGAGAIAGKLELFLPLLPDAPTQEISVRLRAVATLQSPVAMVFFWNGKEVGRLTASDDLPKQVALEIPPEMQTCAVPAVLRIETDSLLTPKDQGLGAAVGFGGIAVTDLFFKAKE